MNLELHPIQTKILNALLFKEKARFKELNTTNLTTDHFTFHVNKLIKDGLISKNPEGDYVLTTKGKEFANRLEAASLLSKDVQYNAIIESTGLSSTTIARISKWLKGSLGGYRLILSRLNHHHNSSKLGKGLLLS